MTVAMRALICGIISILASHVSIIKADYGQSSYAGYSSSGYGSYAAPSYAAPQASYGAPQASYGAPQGGYYAAPTYGVGLNSYKGYGKAHYGKPLVIKKPVIVNKPVVVNKPTVAYKKVYVRPPPPPPPPPIWVNKPVIHKVKEWKLVEVPKVSYQPVLVQPTPYYGKAKGKGKGKGFFKKFKW